MKRKKKKNTKSQFVIVPLGGKKTRRIKIINVSCRLVSITC